MIALIVNPYAGRGRAGERAVSVEQGLHALGPLRRYVTTQAGDERRCAREAVADGAHVVVVVGGDGSVHHTARGLLEANEAGTTAVPLAVFAAGTGNDFVKSLGTPSHDIAAMTAKVGEGMTRSVDIGEIDGIPFVNAAGLGFDVEVLERMQHVTMLRGTAAYVVTAMRALLGYRGYAAHWIRVNGTSADSPHLLTVFANGSTFGGTFRIAPAARIDDGQLDLVDIAALPAWARPGVFLRAIRGTHLTHAHVTHERGASWTIESERPLAFEADGERYRAQSHVLEVRARPGALRVIV